MTREFKSHKSYQDFAFSVRRCWRYARTAEDDNFIEAIIATSDGRAQDVPAGATLWRAQVGYALRKVSDDDFVEGPFPRERMKPPPDWLHEGRAPEGRINAKGIPFLYAATNIEIAISEVRPGRGAFVSVVQLRTSQDLRLINCTTDEEKIPNYVYCKEPDGKEKTLAVWRDIDRAFSQPVAASDDRADYAATQVVAELFRRQGFQGIAYRSSVGPGHNVALFDLDAADIAADPELVEVTSVSLKYSRR